MSNETSEQAVEPENERVQIDETQIERVDDNDLDTISPPQAQVVEEI